MHLTFATILALLAVIGSTALHYEAIRRMDRLARRAQRPYPTLLVVISGLVALHLVEIAVYAILFALSVGPLGLGAFSGNTPHSPMAYIYYAAEAYASLGYGDVVPTGEIRLITAIAPLNGILLLTWSGSFLFSLVEDWRSRAL
ncbi:ion channel [Phenylobacterium sp.]|uniref:ion channel n=1 Tax=Phenylobacterium sp. TaxID=1871053 RepID=UPI00286CAE32|nr:ion channel [Phenylobacterium sp.]